MWVVKQKVVVIAKENRKVVSELPLAGQFILNVQQ